jgi:hypothetical protein
MCAAWQVTKTWIPVGNMSVERAGHQLLTLPNGDALACGGDGNTMFNLVTAELYSPSTQAWSPTGSMRVGRVNFRAVLLASGNVLVAGGEAYAAAGTPQPDNTAEIYSPSTGTWRDAATLPIARDELSMVTLPSGLVLLSGGFSAGSNGPTGGPGTGGAPTINLLYNETADTWTQTGPLVVPDQSGPRSMGFTVLFSSPL